MGRVGGGEGAGVGGEDGEDEGALDVGYEVLERGAEGEGLVGVAGGGEEGVDGGVGGGGEVVGDGVRGGDVVAVFEEGRVVDCWVPVAALPAADLMSFFELASLRQVLSVEICLVFRDLGL